MQAYRPTVLISTVVERLARDFDRDLFLRARQAKDYGIVDATLEKEADDA
jgi:ATP-dependent protease ClpP protease subunit